MDVTLICCVCGTQFQRKAAEARRNAKMGRRAYCSLKCCGADNFNHLKDYPNYDISVHASNKADDLSPFRWHFRRIKQHCQERRKDHHLQITATDLKKQWEKQAGICPYTGWKLVQMENTSVNKQLPLTPDRASVDRIDSSKGYTKDNIQFVAFIAQMAKHQFNESQLFDFCNAVSNHKRTINSSCMETSD